MRRTTIIGLLLLTSTAQLLRAQEATEIRENVVFGMYSGLALLMDIHIPAEGNGAGIVLINGSGWHSGMGMDAEANKSGYDYMNAMRNVLVDKGFTVFSINHRAAPRFRYPDAVEDTKRAVQFVRQHSGAYALDPNNIGAFGHSSGGHLAAMVGVLDAPQVHSEPIDISSQSFKVAAVASIAGVMDFDLNRHTPVTSASSLIAFMGERPAYAGENRDEISGSYREASPLTYVTSDDASFLLLHGTSDAVVPYSQSAVMHEALLAAGVSSELVELEGGHGPVIDSQLIADFFVANLLND